MAPRVAALVGSTAVGKSRVAIEVAEALSAEIVSVDSMQIYAGMTIGTDQPPQDWRQRVPHHLIAEKDPSEELTVAEFQARGRAAIDDITERGRVPLLVGGSGLYFRALVEDLDFPPRAEDVRARLEDELEELGAAGLHERLSELDPAAATRIEPGNARRIVRALEVIELTGKPFSEGYDFDRYDSIYRLAVAGLNRSRADIYARIERRVDEMLDAGLLDEAAALRASGPSRTARQALGYRQIYEATESGALSDKELRAAIVAATKKFAKRQEAWFRADPRVRWFDAADPDLTAQLIAFYRNTLEVP